MWEFSLIYPAELNNYFVSLQKKIQLKLKNELGLCTIINNNLVVACTQKFSIHIIRLIKDSICFVILNYYKANFLLEKLHNYELLQSYTSALLQALINFDKEEDKKIILKNLVLFDSLYLDSFFSFKCEELKTKWQEMCNLTNDNSLFLQDETMLVELLKFFNKSSKTSKEITINIKNQSLVLKNDKNKLIKLYYPLYQNNFSFSQIVVSNIIEQNPQVVKVKNSKNVDVFLLDILSKIFGNNLELIN